MASFQDLAPSTPERKRKKSLRKRKHVRKRKKRRTWKEKNKPNEGEKSSFRLRFVCDCYCRDSIDLLTLGPLGSRSL